MSSHQGSQLQRSALLVVITRSPFAIEALFQTLLHPLQDLVKALAEHNFWLVSAQPDNLCETIWKRCMQVARKPARFHLLRVLENLVCSLSFTHLTAEQDGVR